MTLPQKVTAPISPDAAVATVNCAAGAACDRLLSARAAPATSTEATPPKPLNSATSCGIAVISMRTASTPPTRAPATTPARISSKLRIWRLSSVAITASNMAQAPSRLPRTAVRGWVSPLRPRMKSTAAAR